MMPPVCHKRPVSFSLSQHVVHKSKQPRRCPLGPLYAPLHQHSHTRACLPTPTCADKQVFPKLDVVGWYATGAEVTPEDMEVNRTVRVCPVLCMIHVSPRLHWLMYVYGCPLMCSCPLRPLPSHAYRSCPPCLPCNTVCMHGCTEHGRHKKQTLGSVLLIFPTPPRHKLRATPSTHPVCTRTHTHTCRCSASTSRPCSCCWTRAWTTAARTCPSRCTRQVRAPRTHM